MGNPYLRIFRSIDDGLYVHEHLVDPNYCAESRSLIYAYHLILKDFKSILDYVELHDTNRNTFSHRIYELLLRTCTEIETNCTGILVDNGYAKIKNLNMKDDYFKINKASRLSEYEVKVEFWSPAPLIYKPFEAWNSNTYMSLPWYQNYNEVKHNRNQSFEKANFEALIRALGGLFVILASQFGINVFNQYQPTNELLTYDDKFQTTQDSIFAIKFPQSWTSADYYNDWDIIKVSTPRYQKFPF